MDGIINFGDISNICTEGKCAKCGKALDTTELYHLPEVDEYIRASSMSILHKTVKPEPLNEAELLSKYGYGFNSLFCKSCLDELVEKVKEE